jgi:hypothetical protein
MSAPSDLDVYRRLVDTADELEALAVGASLIGETALKTAATTVRGMANAVYEHALNESRPH